MQNEWAPLRAKFVLVLLVGLLGLALSAFPGSIACGISGKSGGACVEYAWYEIMAAGGVTLVGGLGALTCHRLAQDASDAPAIE